jgi:hypothetical protein
MEFPWLPIWLLVAPIIVAILSLSGSTGVRRRDEQVTNYASDPHHNNVQG